jgi:hypothetical protein
MVEPFPRFTSVKSLHLVWNGLWRDFTWSNLKLIFEILPTAKNVTSFSLDKSFEGGGGSPDFLIEILPPKLKFLEISNYSKYDELVNISRSQFTELRELTPENVGICQVAFKDLDFISSSFGFFPKL